MATVINDRTVVTEVNGRKVVTKRTWPGSGEIGAKHLERERRVHLAVYNALSPEQHDGLRIAEPIAQSSHSDEMWQEYVESSTSAWSILSTPGCDTIQLCAKALRAFDRLHSLQVPSIDDVMADPEMPPKNRMSEDKYRSLPVWGRVFVGRYGSLLQSIHQEYSQLESDGRYETFIHGDLTADNLLVTPTGEVLYFIDWERAGKGSPEHDLAAFYSSILVAKVWKLKAAEAAPSESVKAVTEWLDSWQQLVVDSISEYKRQQPDPLLLRVLVSAKLACRAYAKATTSGPENVLATTIMRVAEVLHGRPSVFRILHQNGVIK